MKTALHHLQQNYYSEQKEQEDFTRTREADFRYSSGMVLCLTSISLMAVFFIFNLLDHLYHILPALVLGTVLPMLTMLRLSMVQKAPVLLFLSGLNFIILSSYIFIYGNSPDASSLFWFMLVPPLVVFSMPKRMALSLFIIFFLTLGLLLFVPAGHELGQRFSLGFKARFMASTILAFAFFWIVEYIRARSDRSIWRAIEHLQSFAFTDPLTGIGNRRDFQNHLKWIAAQSERSGEPFSVAMLDIDHFKQINDAHGHQRGDILLRHVAKNINAALRETDRVFRWGGEEFVVIMPGIDLRDAHTVVERVRGRVEDAHCLLSDGQKIPVTISAGVEDWKKASNLDTVMGNADLRLYLAKKLGRNRVYTGAIDQAVEWFPGLKALPRTPESPTRALAGFPMPMALPAHV